MIDPVLVVVLVLIGIILFVYLIADIHGYSEDIEETGIDNQL